MESGFDMLLKVVIIGPCQSGKSSFLNRYVDDAFNPNYLGTIGVEFKMCIRQFNNTKIKLQLWDTAGQ